MVTKLDRLAPSVPDARDIADELTAKDERLFFRTLLLWAIALIGVVPLLVWFIFVQLGLG